VVSIGALVAGVWLRPSDKEGGLRLLGLCGIALAIVWTFANFRRWAAAEREVRQIEDLADEYVKGGEKYVSGVYIVELTERLRHHYRLTPDQFGRLARAWENMQSADVAFIARPPAAPDKKPPARPLAPPTTNDEE
jgi:hypothetical protein